MDKVVQVKWKSSGERIFHTHEVCALLYIAPMCDQQSSPILQTVFLLILSAISAMYFAYFCQEFDNIFSGNRPLAKIMMQFLYFTGKLESDCDLESDRNLESKNLEGDTGKEGGSKASENAKDDAEEALKKMAQRKANLVMVKRVLKSSFDSDTLFSLIVPPIIIMLTFDLLMRTWLQPVSAEEHIKSWHNTLATYAMRCGAEWALATLY